MPVRGRRGTFDGCQHWVLSIGARSTFASTSVRGRHYYQVTDHHIFIGTLPVSCCLKNINTHHFRPRETGQISTGWSYT